MTVTQSYKSKVIPIDKLHAEKITYALLLYIHIQAFQASPYVGNDIPKICEQLKIRLTRVSIMSAHIRTL